MYGTLDISTSGMIAQRTRLDVISANIANKGTLLDAQGNYNPYRRRIAYFAAGNPESSNRNGRAMGVHVAEIGQDQSPLTLKYAPNSPYADEAGYIREPNVDTTTEQIDAMEAVRAYEANVAAAEATKQMLAQSLRLIT
ncbi:MAG TPA: flagellar basal body rod protein FlgC [Phycisphaerales bacterium]|nr:flagellar basal body rod protein FlgC [Phycisphaerales bacterium]